MKFSRLEKIQGDLEIIILENYRKARKASLLQMTLARKQDIEVPTGSTYVRAHMFGSKEMSPQEIEYRSRRMTGSVYFSEAAIYKAEEIINMSWAGFEEHCRKIVEKMGWEITKVRNKDDGIDIEAFRSVVSGEKEKMIRLFVQCKHWKKNTYLLVLFETFLVLKN